MEKKTTQTEARSAVVGAELPTPLPDALLLPGRLLRLKQFIPHILPMSRSKFLDGVKKGIYPQPVKLGPRVTTWRSDDLIRLIEKGV